MKYTLRPEQQEYKDNVYSDLKEGYKRLIVWAMTGCLTGDTIIHLNRNGWGFKTTIKSAYLAFNGLKKNWKHNFNHDTITYTRSLKEDGVHLNEVLDIIYCGKKEVYEIILDCGKSVKATKDHKFFTEKHYEKLKDLKIGSNLYLDTLKPKKDSLNTKKRDSYVTNLKYHHYAPTTYCNQSKRSYKKVEIHRAVYECKINNITLDEYKFILKNNPNHKLKLIDGKKFHIHHKDENHYNNDPENLECLPIKDHLDKHRDIFYNNFSQGKLRKSKIKEINYIGKEDTYDMSCNYPYNNYVANEIIVHNSGKGLMMPDYVNDFLKYKKKSLIVMRRRDLILQTNDNFKKYNNIKASIIMGNEPGFDPNNPVQISSIDTLKNRIKSDKYSFLKGFDLIIVDESHDTTSPSYQKLFDFLGDKIYLGFTATPFRTGNKPLEFWQKAIQVIKPSELRDKGRLSPCKVFRPKKIDTSHIKKMNGDYSIKELFDVVSDLKIIGDAIESYREYGNGKPAILFAVNKAHSKIMAHAFNSAGIPAVHIDESHNKKERKAAKDGLESGKIKVVTNVNIFSTGWDCPCVEVLIGLRPTLSEILCIQQWGRVLRTFPNKDFAIILDHANNISRFGSPYRDDRKAELTKSEMEKKKKEERIDEVYKCKDCPNCRATIESFHKICPFCNFEFKAEERNVDHIEGELEEFDQGQVIDLKFAKIQKKYNKLLNNEKRMGWKKMAKFHKLHEEFGNIIFEYKEDFAIPSWFIKKVYDEQKIEHCKNCSNFKEDGPGASYGFCHYFRSNKKSKDFCVLFKNKFTLK